MLHGVDGRKPVGARTTRYTHTVLRTALEDARRDGLIAVNPTDDATPPSTTAARAPEMSAWTPAELRTFLTATSDSDHWPLLWVAAFTGMRRSELWAPLGRRRSRRSGPHDPSDAHHRRP